MVAASDNQMIHMQVPFRARHDLLLRRIDPPEPCTATKKFRPELPNTFRSIKCFVIKTNRQKSRQQSDCGSQIMSERTKMILRCDFHGLTQNFSISEAVRPVINRH